MNPKVIPAKAITAKTAPQISNFLLCDDLLSGTFETRKLNEIMAIGTLMKNTSLHKSILANHPPSIGPNMVVNALNIDQVPIAQPLLSFGNNADNNDKLPGTINAPPAPCIHLAIMSIKEESETPHKMEDRVKMIIPMIKIRFLPYISPIAPPTNKSAERNKAYPLTTHNMSVPSIPNPVCSAGNATVSAVESMKAILEARIVPVSKARC